MKEEYMPEFGIYSDQLTDLVITSLAVDPKKFTGSMINNYVKLGLMPRPEKKKYFKEHIKAAVLITYLKEVYSLDEIAEILKKGLDYVNFINHLEEPVDDNTLESFVAGSIFSKKKVLERLRRDETDSQSREV